MSLKLICIRCRQAFNMGRMIGNICIPCRIAIREEIALREARDKALNDVAEDMVLGRSHST